VTPAEPKGSPAAGARPVPELLVRSALPGWPVPAVLVDAQGTVSGANEAASHLLGAEAGKLVGKPLPDSAPGAGGAGTQPVEKVLLPLEGGATLVLLRGSGWEEERRRLQQEVDKLAILVEVSHFLHSSTDLDMVLRVILTGATSGKALGFNRAFLLLVNDTKRVLEGKMGVGPPDPSEAHRVWSELEKLSLRDVLVKAATSLPRDPAIQALVERLTVPLDRKDHLLVQALHGREVLLCDGSTPRCREIQTILGSPAFAVAPIFTPTRRIGVLLADNAITWAGIRPQDLETLAFFALRAAIAIEKAALVEELRAKVLELEETRALVIRHQRLLLESERFRALGEMSARVAHEIRNPLVAIGGFTGRLLRRKGAGDPDLLDLRIILEETQRLERILEQLLDYARPRYPVKLAATSVPALLDSTASIVTELLKQQGIALKVEVGEGLPDVAADRDRLRQLLLDLIRNAQDEMPGGGAITLRATAHGENGVEIEVLDTGPGIRAGDEERIFEPFYTTKPGGSGLGLAVARRIAEEHGAGLEATAGPGGRFVLHLPAWRGEARDKEANP